MLQNADGVIVNFFVIAICVIVLFRGNFAAVGLVSCWGELR